MTREIRQVGCYDVRELAKRSAVSCCDERVLTQQQFADEVDINHMVARYGVSNLASRVRTDGLYGDFTGVHDFESAAERVAAARRSFMSLDPSVRERFGNDPGRFLREVEGLDDEALAVACKPVRPGVQGTPADDGVSPSGGDSAASAAESSA